MDQRLRTLLSALLSREEPLTLADLAERVKVSRRTVQEDLDRLDAWLQDWPEAVIRRKPRLGIQLEADPAVRRRLSEAIAADAPEIDLGNLSPADRGRRLIGLLLAESGPTTMQHLADKLYFSRATIQKDLDGAARWFSSRGLTLKRRPRQGIELCGPEANWRRAVAEYLTEVSDSRLDGNSIGELMRMYPDLNLPALEEAVRATETEMGFRFSTEAYAGLVIHLAVTSERLQQGKEISMPVTQLNEFSTKQEYLLAQHLAARLQESLGLALPTAEVGFISQHLLGARVQANLSQPDELQATLPHLDLEVVALAKRITALAEKALDLPLQNDLQLLAGLALHLRPALNRLKGGMTLRNPILDDLKHMYPSMMGVAWLAAGILEEETGVSVDEDEVGYLAMHLGAAIERAKSRRRVLVVCGSGVGTAQLVASRLRTNFPDLDIVGVVPSLVMKGQDAGADLIIATVPVTSASVPVVRVHPLVREEDLQRLARFLGSTTRFGPSPAHDGSQSDPLKTLRTLLEGRLLQVRSMAATRQGVISDLSRALAEAGYVEEGFGRSARRREEITSTAIGKGVAIPHGEAHFTREAAVAMTVLPRTVDWGGEQVDIVFMLALTPRRADLIESVARELYQLVDDDQALSRLQSRPFSQA